MNLQANLPVPGKKQFYEAQMNRVPTLFHKRRLTIGLAAVLFAVVCQAKGPVAAEGAGFAHPGLLDSMAELSLMREKIRAGAEPWRSGYSQIPSFLAHAPRPVEIYRDGAGHTGDSQDVNQVRLCEDAQAAYGSALHWIATGEEAHARKAMDILNAWSGTLREVKTSGDGSLSTCYGWPGMIYAAEILRHTWGGWPPAEQARFKAVLLERVWPATARAERKDNQNNHTSLALLCRLAIAVYADDRPRFEQVLERLRQQIRHYCYPSGECVETPRDLWHAQMGLAPLVAAAEFAWHQGADLYALDGNRLLSCVEWHIPFILGDRKAPWPKAFDSPYYDPPAKPRETGKAWAFYELVYNHYHNRMGLEAPNTWRMLSAPGSVSGEGIPGRPEGWQRTGGWGTATHGY
jgi:hypothetical protein